MNFLSAVLTILSSFLITFLLMPSLIKYFRAKKKVSRFVKKVLPGMLKRLGRQQWEDYYSSSLQ